MDINPLISIIFLFLGVFCFYLVVWTAFNASKKGERPIIWVGIYAAVGYAAFLLKEEFGWLAFLTALLIIIWNVYLTKTDQRVPVIFSTAGFYIIISLFLVGYVNGLPQQRPEPPPEELTGDITMEQFVAFGEKIIFKPDGSPGRGKCPLCHSFKPGEQKRAPFLPDIATRAIDRIKSERYLSVAGKTDPSGKTDFIVGDVIKEITGGDMADTAKVAWAYIQESMLCPSCYVAEGYGKQENSGEWTSPMPLIDKPSIELSEVEQNAVIAYLLFQTLGDYNAIPAPLLPTGAVEEEGGGDEGDGSSVLNAGMDVPTLMEELGCTTCHLLPDKIEGGDIGPSWAGLKDRAGKYKKGMGAKEYITESILFPSAHIIECEDCFEVEDGVKISAMDGNDFGEAMTAQALHKIVEYLLNET